MNSKQKGDIAEAFVIAKCLEKCWIVLKPFGDNLPYDIVVDRGFGFEKVQIKSSTYHNGSIQVYLLRVRSNTKKEISKKYRKEDFDLLGVYSPETKKVLLVPFSKIEGKIQTNFRVEKPKNNQSSGVVFSESFEIK